jgi:hypothetical protein
MRGRQQLHASQHAWLLLAAGAAAAACHGTRYSSTVDSSLTAAAHATD